MAVDERARHEMYTRLQEVLGAEVAATLVEHLPPVGWAHVATKPDIEHLRVATTMDFQAFQASMRSEFHDFQASMRSEFHDFQASMRSEFHDFQATMTAEIQRVDQRFELVDERFNTLEHKLTSTFQHELRAQTNTMLFGLVGALVTNASLAFALTKFT